MPQSGSPDTRWFLAVACVLLLASAGSADDAKYADLSGTVVDDAGTPVLSYVVRAVPPAGSPLPQGDLPYAISDAKGRFTIERLPPGRYRLLAGDSETHAKMDPMDARAGDRDVTVRVIRLRIIEGVVLDPDGKPLAHQDVRIKRLPAAGARYAADKTRGGEALVRATRTDEAGRFQIERYPSSEPVEIRVTIPRTRLRELQPIAVPDVVPGARRLELVAQRTLSIRGVVRAEDGSPLAGARVNGVVADAAGRFEIRPVKPGASRRLKAVGPLDPERVWLPEMRKDVRGGTHELEFVLKRGHVVSGAVRGLEPVALRGLEIRAQAYGAAWVTYAFDGVTTEFRLAPLPRGRCTLIIAPRRRSRPPTTRLVWRHGASTIVTAPSTGVVIQTAVGYTLSGSVDAPPGAGAIHLTYYDTWGRPHHARTQVRAGTTFEIRRVPPGAGLLVARSHDGAFAALLDGVDPTKAEVAMRLVATATISGRIDALPAAVSRGTVTARHGRFHVLVRLSPNNSFETKALPPGRWSLEFDVAGPLGGIVPTLHDVEAGVSDVVATWSPDK